jgi:hypothetical protein
VAVFALLLSATAAWAERPAGAVALDQARDAWGRGEFPQAEALYQEALSRGGLKRDQALECWVHVGSARAVLGKKDLAMAAFRQAALMDASFAVPPEAGKRALQVAEAVRKQQVGFGELRLKLNVPTSPPASVPLPVIVSMDAAHTGLVTRLFFVAKDTATTKGFEFENLPADSVKFTIPSSLMASGADLLVRVDALDGSDNQLASSETHVRVRGVAAPGGIAEQPEEKHGGGFWSSPWPYVIGGVVLSGAVAGTVGIYFGAKTPTQVNVGAPTIRPGG